MRDYLTTMTETVEDQLCLAAVHFLGTTTGDMLISLIYAGAPMPEGCRRDSGRPGRIKNRMPVTSFR